jgi:hypothetical protein
VSWDHAWPEPSDGAEPLDHRDGAALDPWPRPDAWVAPALEGQAHEPVDPAWPGPDTAEPLRHGGTYLLDLVAAVDHLGRGLRHDFTVWDALEEALRSWLAEDAALGAGAVPDDRERPDEDDPLYARLRELVERLADDPSTSTADAMQQAVRHWVAVMAHRYNAGYHWPHPAERRAFPPPLLEG